MLRLNPLSVVSLLVCCAGHLTNLSELLRRNGKGSNPMSPSFSGDVNNASSLERKSSIERSLDLGATTASLVLNMYLDGQRDDNEVIMLSELQVRGGTGSALWGFAIALCSSREEDVCTHHWPAAEVVLWKRCSVTAVGCCTGRLAGSAWCIM